MENTLAVLGDGGRSSDLLTSNLTLDSWQRKAVTTDPIVPWLRDSNVPHWVYKTFAAITFAFVLLATRVRVDTRPRVWTHTWESIPDVIVPYFVLGCLALLVGLCWLSNRISHKTCQEPAWIINCWTFAIVLGTVMFFGFISES